MQLGRRLSRNWIGTVFFVLLEFVFLQTKKSARSVWERCLEVSSRNSAIWVKVGVFKNIDFFPPFSFSVRGDGDANKVI